MTIDEAIQHCEEVAEKNERRAESVRNRPISSADFYHEEESCSKCANEHRQLAEWLKELKAYKEQNGDAISRQAVLNAMYELCNTGETLKENPWRDNPHIDAVVEAIEELPSATPQQRTGRWIEHDFDQLRKMGYYRCSECNIGYQRYERGERKSELPNINGQKYELHRIDNYCPNCGAKMEVEDAD